MLIQERLQLILKMHNISASTFADKIGVQRSNVSHVLSGRNKPSLDFLEKIILHFPRVNAYWLLTGEMSNDQAQQVKKEDSIENKNLTTKSNDKDTSSDIEKVLVKIVEFYSDETFTEYYPKNQ